MIDSRDINDLHPAVARGCRELIRRMEAIGWPVIVTATYRDNEKQDALYAQGRTTPGPIVTNARGGQSIHNYRLAFDIARNVKGQEYTNPQFFADAGAIWMRMGGEWGGSWASFPDRPHMQYTGGLTLANLQAGRTLPQDAKMPWELEQGKPGPEEEDDMPRFQKFEELPDWAKPTIRKLLDRKYLLGTDIGLNLTEDALRIFVVNDRAGLYDLVK